MFAGHPNGPRRKKSALYRRADSDSLCWSLATGVLLRCCSTAAWNGSRCLFLELPKKPMTVSVVGAKALLYGCNLVKGKEGNTGRYSDRRRENGSNPQQRLFEILLKGVTHKSADYQIDPRAGLSHNTEESACCTQIQANSGSSAKYLSGLIDVMTIKKGGGQTGCSGGGCTKGEVVSGNSRPDGANGSTVRSKVSSRASKMCAITGLR